MRIITATLSSSNGVIKDKTPAAVDVVAEVDGWKEQFRVKVAELLKKAVEGAMPDYE